MSDENDIFGAGRDSNIDEFVSKFTLLGYSSAEIVKIILKISKFGSHQDLEKTINSVISRTEEPSAEIMFIIKFLLETHIYLSRIYGEAGWCQNQSGCLVREIAGYSIRIEPKQNGRWQAHFQSQSDNNDIFDFSIHFQTLDAAKRWALLTAAYGGRLDDRYHGT
ncbi:hypothetical protein [Zavarzinia compransoris]|uniref:hypothetical protein n=1 Tax=Zavarzinia compransoris TaxID=1264899 RepID=UPI001060037B|nr:hypothetical protein [Zavarzinia compransoris]